MSDDLWTTLLSLLDDVVSEDTSNYNEVVYSVEYASVESFDEEEEVLAASPLRFLQEADKMYECVLTVLDDKAVYIDR